MEGGELLVGEVGVVEQFFDMNQKRIFSKEV